MTKKLLVLLFLSFSVYAFSQKSISNLSAAPNPFSYQTSITFSSAIKQEVVFSIKNVLGKTVLQRKVKVKKGKNTIPFQKDNLKSGMYIYAIRNSKELISKRFVIK